MTKKILAILLLAGPVHAVCSGYTYQRALTISTFSATVPQMVTNVFGTVNNFPVLISTTNVIYSTAAGTGQLLNSNGYDLTYSSDSACSFMLNWDTETVITAGIQATYNAWVQVPTLSTATATAATFYQNWGNSSITSYVGHSTGVWDSNFKGVYHFPDGTTLSTKDSTSNGNNGTNNSATAISADVDGGISTTAGTKYVTLGTGAYTALSNNYTLEGWGNMSSGGCGYGGVIGDGSTAVYLGFDPSGNAFAKGPNSNQTSSKAVLNAWHEYAVTISATTGQILYIDGVAVATSAGSTGGVTPGTGLYSGAGLGGCGGTGTIDENRISNSVRNSDWFLSEYNTVNSSATFVNYGSIQAGVSYIPQNQGLLIQGGKLTIKGGKVTIL